MVSDEKSDRDRIDELQEVVDKLATGGASTGAPASTGPHAESLREAVHRRMHELKAESEAKEKRTEKASGSDDEST
ncbi:hypothetical protein ACF1BE_26620 [Streptomyces sp. NPDC014991]|uniref:hypothetical protein n=1 Tax=Streptomyces sp. NPDC014991 TaxID=3364935 RepID=UPI0036F9EC79